MVAGSCSYCGNAFPECECVERAKNAYQALKDAMAAKDGEAFVGACKDLTNGTIDPKLVTKAMSGNK